MVRVSLSYYKYSSYSWCQIGIIRSEQLGVKGLRALATFSLSIITLGTLVKAALVASLVVGLGVGMEVDMIETLDKGN
jgi:hypothetical protein